MTDLQFTILMTHLTLIACVHFRESLAGAPFAILLGGWFAILMKLLLS